jgi:DNA-binding transcriptional LysR family regulator
LVQKSTTNWDDVRLFLALARNSSARAAAASLGVSHTTVVRRTDDLEKSLGARLFDRHVSGYRLTAAGESLLTDALRAEEALLGAERRLHGRDAQLQGEIVLTTGDIVATHLIMPDLVGFSREYPEIDLNLVISYDVFDLGRREADVAVRFMGRGRTPPDNLVGRKLVTGRSCYYASPDYLAQHPPGKPGSGARWIGWDDDVRYPEWVKNSPHPDVPAYNKFNNVVVQLEAARQGMGIAVLPCFVGDRATDLVRLPGSKPYDNFDIWLLSHPDLRDAARLRIFRKFIVDVFARRHAALVGE